MRNLASTLSLATLATATLWGAVALAQNSEAESAEAETVNSATSANSVPATSVPETSVPTTSRNIVEGETVSTTIPAGYELVWSDEFSKPGLPDTTKWDYDVFRNKEGWFNNEKQYYSSDRLENARVENGHLIIEAREETLSAAEYPDWGKQKYTSARMITKGLGDWTYGYFEIRAKLPCGVGTWPAIWMLPSSDIEWPKGGEIDIMEHVGFEPGVVHHSVHTSAYNFGRGTQKTTKRTIEDACETMHKYQLLWMPEFLLFGIDDKPNFLYKKDSDKTSKWPFDKPQHLLLNVAVGGSWGGQKGVRASAFPAQMEIDYVRVYQPAKIAKVDLEQQSIAPSGNQGVSQ